MAIDERDPAYLFGQVITRLNAHDETLQTLVEKIDGVGQAITTLPCNVTLRRVEELEVWRKDCEESKRETARAGVSFRSGLILVLVSVFFSAATGSIVSTLLG